MSLEHTYTLERGQIRGFGEIRLANDFVLATGLATFFTFMTVAEGGGKRAVLRKFQDVYIPALKANFMVWPLVQIINFRLMPIQFQIVSFPAQEHPFIRIEMLTSCLFLAFRFDNRYCLDGISLPQQRG